MVDRVSRRLAAILAADVVGYSRMMHEDEAGTLALVSACRAEVIEPCIEEHNGRLFKTMGDGYLAEFASVVDAVACAVAVQERVGAHEATAGGAALCLRVGVNLGDVIVEDGDVFGDGVNVAVRLEGLAEPGGIVVSGTVCEHVRGRLPIVFADLGRQQVKNIADPVHAYGVVLEGTAHIPQLQPVPPTVPEAPSIAVLPFVNMSSDVEQDYFSDGITEDIITGLSKVAGLLVIARNSTFVYKGRSVGMRQVGRELGVRHVLEGSVRKAGDRLRITTRLIDADDERQLWADRYDGALDDIFALQDQVTSRVVGAIAPKLAGLAAERRREPTPEVYDRILRARRDLALVTPQGNAAARAELTLALDADPDAVDALVLLVECHFQQVSQIWAEDPVRELAEGLVLARRAVALDGRSSDAYANLGRILQWQRKHEEGLSAFDTAIALSPNNAGALRQRAIAIAFSRVRPADDAIADALAASRLDPNAAYLNLWALGLTQHHAGRPQEAKASLERARAFNPDFVPTHAYLAMTLLQLGDRTGARREVAEIRRINPRLKASALRTRLPYGDPAELDAFADALVSVGLPPD